MNKNSVAAHYDAASESYAEKYQHDNFTCQKYPQNYFRLQIVLRRLLANNLKSVYEVGVGEGTPLAQMAKSGFDVAGCDISHAMADKARDTFKNAGLDPDVIAWGDIEDILTIAPQLNGKQFDSVVAAGVMPHVSNDGLVLDNISALIRPQGRVLIEFRNKLFSLFTFNRLTLEFIVDDLLRDVPRTVKEAVIKELKPRLALELPKPRAGPDGGPSYDSIPAKYHNPFELMDLFRSRGFHDPIVHWYHFHPAPPMLEPSLGQVFRDVARTLEHQSDWRGFFLCSAGVIEASKI
jgi:2-polyprenyl-3-methyl-5-hydroxy-6-metoxy-1,4-benzoquinol methylase